MKRRGWFLIAIAGLLFLCGVAPVALNAYSVSQASSILTPAEVHFDPSLSGRTVTENGIYADFFCKHSPRPQKVVIILGGSEGGKHWSANTAHIQQLLDQDYCALILAYFHAPGLPETLREIPLEYFERTFDWLASQKQVVPHTYALIGHSRGGELALLLASRYPQVKAVVALAPASVVFPGSPQGLFDLLAGQHSAWSYQGLPLPFVPWPVAIENAPGLVTFQQVRMFEQALENQEAVKAAVIPVEKIGGPLLCFSAANDTLWPSQRMCDQVMKRLDEKGIAFYREHVSHEQGHGWCGLQGCWDVILDFLGEHFK